MEHYYLNIQGYFNFQLLYDEMVEKLPSGSHFVEVGSWLGRSAIYLGVQIVNSGKDIKLDCVDNWTGSPELAEEDAIKNGTLYKDFLKNIEPLRKIIKPIRENSFDAADFYEDESLDVVYIDANHTAEYFKKDLWAWYPKVKIGGIVSGHDYDYPGIKSELGIFFPTRDFEIRPCSSWVHYKK